MWKPAKIPAVVCVALLAGACVSIEGRYSPDCIAFAGDTIDLAGGRFEWDKFTDQVRTDGEGKVVDAFPEYPKQGSYRVDGDRLSMTSDSGETLPVFYLVRSGDRSYLYTQDQYSAREQGGKPARCPLVRGGFREPE